MIFSKKLIQSLFNYCHLLSTYYMIETILDALHILSWLIFTILRGGYFSQFTDERIEARDIK